MAQLCLLTKVLPFPRTAFRPSALGVHGFLGIV